MTSNGVERAAARADGPRRQPRVPQKFVKTLRMMAAAVPAQRRRRSLRVLALLSAILLPAAVTSALNATEALSGLSYSLPTDQAAVAEPAEAAADGGERGIQSLNGLLSWALGARARTPHRCRHACSHPRASSHARRRRPAAVLQSTLTRTS